ncbi:MAG: preprotein translocase subunit SecE [Actinomycetota bacterium]
MNRQMKRMQQRQGKTAPERQAAAATARRTASQEKRKRTAPGQFLREVRQELRKVDWPTREETTSYSIVVLVTVIVLTSFVFLVDLGFSKAIVNLFGN